MFFEERVFVVEDVVFSTQTAYGGKKLTINKQALIDHVSEGIENIETIDVHLARPGEVVRIVNVMDGYEPRVEKSGQALFPGFLRAPVAIDPCAANCLRGVAVLTASKVRAVNPLFTPKQAVVDMSGPGASMSLFCETINVVLEIKLPADLADTEKDQVIRLIGIRAADYLARTTLDQEPQEVKPYPELTPAAGLPKIAAVIHLGGEAALHDNFVYGRGITGIFPTYIDMAEFFFSAVVGGNFTYACQRNFTYCYQNSRLLKRLYEGHGKTHSFVGLVISRCYNQSHFDKTMSASYAAQLVKKLSADGVIVTAEGAGNAHVDVMFVCQECEKLGVKTVVGINEIAGPEGTDPSLVDFVTEADAIVTNGNREEFVAAGQMHTIGGARLAESGGQVLISTRDYCGATSEIGQWHIGTKEY